MFRLHAARPISTLAYLAFFSTIFLAIIPAHAIQRKFVDLPPEDKWPPLAADYSPPASNYTTCLSPMTGMGLYRVQDLANDMLNNIADTQVGIDSKGLTRQGKYNGGCQLVWSIGGGLSDSAAYLCARDADAPVFACGDFKGGDMANALLELDRDCHYPDCNGGGECQTGGTVWINGRKNESCAGDPLGAYFAYVP